MFTTLTFFRLHLSNAHSLGLTEVEVVQALIDGVNRLWKEDRLLQKKHGLDLLVDVINEDLTSTDYVSDREPTEMLYKRTKVL